MNRLVLTCLLGTLAMPASAMQQTSPAPPQPAQAQPQGRGGRGATPPPTQPAQPGVEGQAGGRGRSNTPLRYDSPSLQNIRVEITLTDTLTAEAPAKKSVSMIIVDNNSGQIRSQGPSSLSLNVDAEPHVRPDGKVFLSFSVYYQPDSAPNPSGSGPVRYPAVLNQSLSVILTDGKPMVVSQSADPKGDRKVTVEVTATVVK